MFRYYWVLVKLLISALVTLIVLQLEMIAYRERPEAGTTLFGADLRSARLSLVIHAGAGLAASLLSVILSHCRPRRPTRYGWRKQPGGSGISGARSSDASAFPRISIGEERASCRLIEGLNSSARIPH